MRAWVAERFGEPSDVLVVRNVDMPSPGPTDVLVKVEAATLNKNDIEAIWGRWPSLMTLPPFTPGLEVVGTIVETGVHAARLHGKRVVGSPRMSYKAEINRMFAEERERSPETVADLE